MPTRTEHGRCLSSHDVSDMDAETHVVPVVDHDDFTELGHFVGVVSVLERTDAEN